MGIFCVLTLKNNRRRPTAEKLLQHPFFKQAKKKDYLVKSVLAGVPPLEQRPHKKIGFKQTTIESSNAVTQQWDFDDDENNEKDTTATAAVDIPVGNAVSAMTSATTAAPPVQQQKTHISFGNITVNDLPSPPVPTVELAAAEIASPAPIRKSRFVIEENANLDDRNESNISSHRSLSPPASSSHLLSAVHSFPPPSATATQHPLANESIDSTSAQQANDPTTTKDWQSAIGSGLGISAIPTTVATSLQKQQQQQNIIPEAIESMEVKKGRFSCSVNNQQTAPPALKMTNLSDTSNQDLHSPLRTDSPLSEFNSLSLSRIASTDSIKSGKEKTN